ncbi:MAG: CocE/NonD family hydrolase [Alcanivorax sediminis]|uniref:CocE/NonD family hydrolase n=1 Tax=Alcanivorax sediminis TaxID=2663008 RepID=A0A6N7LRR8_9GAMM|nr:CocE/NonD family hydrolase [Alcanivorax sediminis]MQX51824.1 CocE/NonD family hydrolase [Alcanivorax sediminis]
MFLLHPVRYPSLSAGVLTLSLLMTACGGGGSSPTPVDDSQTVSPPPAPNVSEPEPEPETPTQKTVNLTWPEAYQREDDYPGSVSLPQQLITLRDGIRLAATVTLPADEDGNAIAGQFPVIATFTGYNQYYSGMALSDNALVQKGYAYITVDMRGTGASEGSWQAFSQIDHDDIAELVNYIKAQPWSNGTIGMNGASYMGITGLLAGATGDPAVKAIFAIVPMADAYRDVVFGGGQANAGFIPLWVTLVTGLSLLPTPVGFDNSDPGYTLTTLLQHLQGALTEFQAPVVAGALIGNENKFDTPFWRIRSPIEKVAQITAPTFVVGGLHDIFQRGEPLIYEGLKDHTNAKLLIGPWTHVDGSSGANLPADGVPDLASIRLAWFDHYLKGMDTGAESYPPVTQYYKGAERYITAADWPHPDAHAETFYLHGKPLLPQLGSITRQPPAARYQTSLLQTPINGLCSASASQWTAGLLGLITPPCAEQDNVVNLLEAVYTSEPLAEAMAINGPITGQIWASTTAFDTNVTVRVSIVDENGLARPLTHGIQMASMSANEPERARYMDDKLVQPWHPFSAESQRSIMPFEPFQADVEVLSTSAVIAAGERLRISVGASDLPHGISPLPDLLASLLGALTIYSAPEMPSRVNIPLVPVESLQ